MTTPNQLPVNIQIHTVSGSSGIYFGGQIVVSGISSHSKSNAGLGAIGSSNTLYRNFSYVYDPDIIDTQIDDRDTHIFNPQTAPNVPTQIGVGAVSVNTMTQNSGVFMGTTNITGMDSHEKQNFGSGHIWGNWNLETGNQSISMDSDTVDAWIQDQDYKAGVFLNR